MKNLQDLTMGMSTIQKTIIYGLLTVAIVGIVSVITTVTTDPLILNKASFGGF